VKKLTNLADIDEPKDDVQQSSSSATMESSHDSATSGTDNKSYRLKLRRPRVSSRRHLSKSEPAGQDDTNDSEDQVTGGSEESQPLLGSSHTVRRDDHTYIENKTNTVTAKPTSLRS
jgi:hypothetical protein